MSSIFDILGPVMVGPSSSHTAGAVNIGRVARQVLGSEPTKADITLYGSFSKTYQGHGTDRAIVGGILGMSTDDPRIKDSLKIADDQKITIKFTLEEEHPYHPNTAKINVYSDENIVEIIGVSIGGGRILIKEIGGFHVNISGEYHTLVCSYDEQKGVIAQITAILADKNINIAFMNVSRNQKRDKALMIIEADHAIPEAAVNEIKELGLFTHVKHLEKIQF